MALKHTSPRSVTVLVVDDEEPVRKFVDRVLRDAGYQTALASGGPEALAKAADLPALDILVTDVMMPRMSGDDLARQLREKRPAVKVLYLTGFSDNLFKEQATLGDAEAYLDKPCSIRSLQQAVSLLVFGRVDAPKNPKADS